MLVALMLIERCSQSRIDGTSGTWYTCTVSMDNRPTQNEWKVPSEVTFGGRGTKREGVNNPSQIKSPGWKSQVVHEMLFMKILHFWKWGGGWGASKLANMAITFWSVTHSFSETSEHHSWTRRLLARLPKFHCLAVGSSVQLCWKDWNAYWWQ